MNTLIYERIAFLLEISVEELFEKLPKDTIDKIITTLLKNRDLEEHLLTDMSSHIIDPREITNANIASIEIYNFIKNPENTLLIFADFDVDGIMSGNIIAKGLEEVASCSIIPYFPNRNEGYGLSEAFCNNVIKNYNASKTMIVTVDNGITKVNEVKLLKDNGFKVIITDHHESQEIVPDCIIVDAHNKHEKQSENTAHLCGAGIAFKITQLVQELSNHYGMEKYLPHLAIATIADVMPFHPENLAIIQLGIEILNSDYCPEPFISLKKVSKIKFYSVENIAWTLAPMLNACGRMGNIHLASNFIYSNMENEESAKEIFNTNERRKRNTKSATEKIKKVINLDNAVSLIALNDKKLENGLLGILAGKVVEITGKPAIVTKITDGICSGSTRSACGINMLEVFKNISDSGIPISYGGHAAACGVSFPEEYVKNIQDYLNEHIIIEEESGVEESDVEMTFDLDLPLAYADRMISAILSILPADGKNISQPVFNFKDVEIISTKQSGSNPENGFLEIKDDTAKKRIFLMGGFPKLLDYIKISPKEEKCKISIIGRISQSFWNEHYFTVSPMQIKELARHE